MNALFLINLFFGTTIASYVTVGNYLEGPCTLCLGLASSSAGKEPACQCKRHKRPGFSSWVERCPGGGNGKPLQYACLENSIDRKTCGLQSMGSQRVGHNSAIQDNMDTLYPVSPSSKSLQHCNELQLILILTESICRTLSSLQGALMLTF